MTFELLQNLIGVVSLAFIIVGIALHHTEYRHMDNKPHDKRKQQ